MGGAFQKTRWQDQDLGEHRGTQSQLCSQYIVLKMMSSVADDEVHVLALLKDQQELNNPDFHITQAMVSIGLTVTTVTSVNNPSSWLLILAFQMQF